METFERQLVLINLEIFIQEYLKKVRWQLLHQLAVLNQFFSQKLKFVHALVENLSSQKLSCIQAGNGLRYVSLNQQTVLK